MKGGEGCLIMTLSTEAQTILIMFSGPPIAILHGILASSKQLLSFELNSHLASCFDLKSELW